MVMHKDTENVNLADIRFVKTVSIGHVNKPTSEEEMQAQVEYLNKCLHHHPRGRIIGKNVSTFMFTYEDLPGRYEQTVFQIGWKRIPHWIEHEEKKAQGLE